MATTRAASKGQRKVACKVVWSDERCPDGCCGHKVLYVTSPKTGRELAIADFEMTAELYRRLPYIDGTYDGSDDRRGPSFWRGVVSFSIAELEAMVKAGHLANA